jgi:hypothetical protein
VCGRESKTAQAYFKLVDAVHRDDRSTLEQLSLAINIKHRVVICLSHMQILDPSNISSHFKNTNYHRLSQLQDAQTQLKRILDDCNIPPHLPLAPMEPIAPLNLLLPPTKGFICTDCPYAVISSESARTHDKLGHATAFGYVQKVAPQTYWKVTHGVNPPCPPLPGNISLEIQRQVKEMFRPTLPPNVETLSTM